MAHVLIMPRQGNTVESCVLVTWKVKEGDRVAEETPVCDVETDKATFEVPAGASGTVLKLLFPEGEDIPVLQPIAVIGNPGEDWAVQLPAGAAPASASAAPVAADAPVVAASEAPTTSAAAPVQDDAAVGSSPRARKLARQEALSLGSLPGSGPGGRVIERDVRAALAQRPALTAAARAAVAAGAAVPATGTGLGGRATSADLASAAASAAPGDQPQVRATEVPSDFPGPVKETPVKGIRKLIAARMLESLTTTAQFTLNGAAEATRLQSVRARFKASAPELGLAGVTINDLLLFLVARLLPAFPGLNAHKTGDTLRVFERVHLGVAMDTPRGLMVPVLRNADRLPLTAIAAETKRLGEACRNNTVQPDELTGSTFTVTNLGALGVESFTPVLNVPEVAILGVGGLVPRPVMDAQAAGGVRFAPHLGLSLTINHQVVDGYPAAQFLKALREAVADIDLWLMR